MTTQDLRNSPVLALEGNILWQLENLKNDRKERLLAEVNAGLLRGEIALHMDAVAPRGPFLQAREDGIPEVHLQVAFLEMLWAFVYSWMILYEEGMQRPLMPGTELPTGPAPGDLLARAAALLNWSKSLAHGHSNWPAHLPSPTSYGNAAERYFGEKANLVFQQATAFLLNHERAHAIFEHLPVLEDEPTDPHLRLQLEKEADVFAFEGLVHANGSDNEKASESWAILALVLATFYVYKDPRQALISTTHPSLHHRLGNLVHSLEWQSAGYRSYFPLLCRVVLQDLFPEILAPKAQFDDAEDALTDALDRLDELMQP